MNFIMKLFDKTQNVTGSMKTGSYYSLSNYFNLVIHNLLFKKAST